MVPIFRPETAVALAIAQGLLKANGIPFFVHNAGFGGLYPGPQIEFYNVRTILVPPSAADAARQVLGPYLTPPPAIARPPRRSLWELARMIVETICCGWFVPRARATATDEKARPQ